MRLINAETLRFEEFFDRERPPPYFILSHRWGDDEISYKDYRKGRRKESKGYAKVIQFCAFARERHQLLQEARPDLHLWESHCYVWIDTCCIDKSSSAELSEAINAMYEYYSNAIECHAYLADVTFDPLSAATPESNEYPEYLPVQWAIDAPSTPVPSGLAAQPHRSVWFTRGWTLQELLAPHTVLFLNREWTVVAHKHGSEYLYAFSRCPTRAGSCANALLEHVTGIAATHLSFPGLIRSASVACRMSWASRRKLTRIEDQPYCLLGIFDVNMPLLYGERGKAFMRLQEEIMKRSSDLSIFAWAVPASMFDNQHLFATSGLLAPDPLHFQHCADVEWSDKMDPLAFAITNVGIQMTVQADYASFSPNIHALGLRPCLVVVLKCWREGSSRCQIFLQEDLADLSGVRPLYRLHPNPWYLINKQVDVTAGEAAPQTIYLEANTAVRMWGAQRSNTPPRYMSPMRDNGRLPAGSVPRYNADIHRAVIAVEAGDAPDLSFAGFLSEYESQMPPTL